MITTLEKKIYPVAKGEYTRITAELLYNSNGKYYYIAINHIDSIDTHRITR